MGFFDAIGEKIKESAKRAGETVIKARANAERKKGNTKKAKKLDKDASDFRRKADEGDKQRAMIGGSSKKTQSKGAQEFSRRADTQPLRSGDRVAQPQSGFLNSLRNYIAPVANELNKPAPDWMQKANQGLSKFSQKAESVPRFSFADRIKNPVVKFLAGIPESIANTPSDIVSGGLGGYGRDISPFSSQGRSNLLTKTGQAVGVGLNIGGFLGGGSAAANLAKEGARDIGKQTLFNVAKEGAITGVKQGVGYGAGAGVSSALQSQGTATEKLSRIPEEVIKNAAIGGVLGGALGGSIPVISHEVKNQLLDIKRIIKPEYQDVVYQNIRTQNPLSPSEKLAKPMILDEWKVSEKIPPKSALFKALSKGGKGLSIEDVSGGKKSPLIEEAGIPKDYGDKIIDRIKEKAYKTGLIKNVETTNSKIVDRINNQAAPSGVDIGSRTLKINKLELLSDIKHIESGGKMKVLGKDITNVDDYIDSLVSFESNHIKNATIGNAIKVSGGGDIAKKTAKKLDELNISDLTSTKKASQGNEWLKGSDEKLEKFYAKNYVPTLKPKATGLPQAGKEAPVLDIPKVSSYPEPSTVLSKGQEPQNMSAFRKFFTGGEKVLKRSGEGGKKLAQKMESQRKAEDLLKGKWNVHIDNALKKLNKEQKANVDAVLRGEAKPMDAQTAGASKSLRNWYNSIGKKAEEMGFEIQSSSGVRTPFKPRENYAPQMYDFTKLQKGAQRDKALTHLVESGQFRNKAEATRALDTFIKQNAERRFGNLEKAREIDLPGFERDPAIYAKKYAQSVAKRFTEVENFGKKDVNVAKFIDQIAQEGGDYNSAQRIFDYTTRGAPQNKVVNAITQYNLATQLDLSAITNATQSINTAAKAGVVNTIKGAAKGFAKKGKEIAELSGVYDDFIHSKETGVSLNKIVKMVMWPFQKVENFNRRTAANTGAIRAQKLAEGELTNFAKRELESLGINPANIKNGRLSKDDMLSAAYEMARKTQFKVDPLDVPTAWKDPTGKLVTQFQSFSFMQTKFIRDSILKEAQKGNFMPLVRFIPLAIGASYASNYVRNLVTGRDPKQANKDMDIRAWDKWGKAFGDFATNKIIQGKFLYDTYKNDFNTPLKKVTRTLGSVGGPTVGKIGSMLNALEAIPNQKEKNLYLRKSGREQDPFLEAKRFASGEIPFVGEYLKNKEFSYPKSTTSPERKAENTKVYDFADEMNKFPYGDPTAKEMTRVFLESIPNEDERKRQEYILSENGVDTKGISTSDDVIKGRPIYKEIQGLIDAGKMDEATAKAEALSPKEQTYFKAAKQSAETAKTNQIKTDLGDKMQSQVPEIISLMEQGKSKEALKKVEELYPNKDEMQVFANYVKAEAEKRKLDKAEQSFNQGMDEAKKMGFTGQEAVDYAQRQRDFALREGEIQQGSQQIASYNQSMTDKESQMQSQGIQTASTETAVNIPQSTLAGKNNNPGNLRYAGQQGASEGQGGFARFDSPQAGYEALQNQIRLDAERGLTVEQFVTKYAPPSENDTGTYIKQFVSKLGTGKDTPIGNLDPDKVAQFMAFKESGTQVGGEQIALSPQENRVVEAVGSGVMTPQKAATQLTTYYADMVKTENPIIEPQVSEIPTATNPADEWTRTESWLAGMNNPEAALGTYRLIQTIKMFGDTIQNPVQEPQDINSVNNSPFLSALSNSMNRYYASSSEMG